ncbi:MAG: peptidoglycan DD-metalloendopeptidase family protein [Marinifilaceae bacterium]|jgi:murein DD-endopeptidase MepM/ murein hydrolase activator NlpD|nr:peptidoglycan DD-metalloendopeptidase family protein [Marinifilaceae bacterium]
MIKRQFETISEFSINDIILNHRDEFSKLFPFEISKSEILEINLSSESLSLNKNTEISAEIISQYINNQLNESNSKIAIGGYLEKRNIYQNRKLFSATNTNRDIHLGIDIWCDEYTPIQSPLNAKIHSFKDNNRVGDYGPTIILEHCLEGNIFYSLYGHLSQNSLNNLKIGDYINSGEAFAEIGSTNENGNWPPHLHIQLITDIEEYKGDYPGVCEYLDLEKYKLICPNPKLILKF